MAAAAAGASVFRSQNAVNESLELGTGAQGRELANRVSSLERLDRSRSRTQP